LWPKFYVECFMGQWRTKGSGRKGGVRVRASVSHSKHKLMKLKRKQQTHKNAINTKEITIKLKTKRKTIYWSARKRDGYRTDGDRASLLPTRASLHSFASAT